MLYQKAGAMPRSSFSKRELLTVVLCMLICSLVDFAEMLGGYYIGAGTHVAVTNERSSKDKGMYLLPVLSTQQCGEDAVQLVMQV